MLKPLHQYLKDEGMPRCKGILLTPEAFIGVAAVALVIVFGDKFFSVYPKTSDLTTGLIAYASIALGFCVAGLTISLTLPDKKFAVRMATLHRDSLPTNAYSDLLFVFSWTAVAHWVALVALFCVVLFTEGSGALLPAGRSDLRLWIIALIGGLCAYCLCLFLITLITLSQVGNVYIRFLSEHPDTKDA